MDSSMRSPRRSLAGLLSLMPMAACALTHDFEDGTLQGWFATLTGGSGSTGVESRSGSRMAAVHHAGSSLTSLSKDFAFTPAATLAFDMQAIATAGGFGVAGYGGVTISFLNALNVSQASLSLLNTTNPTSLGAMQSAVDASPHHYAGSMASFATAAGLASTASIAKITVTFLAYGGSNAAGASGASVWFDNVIVGAPPPGCLVQLGKTTHVDGDPITAKVARFTNPDVNAVPVELKLWFEPSGTLAPIPFTTLGADGSVVLPAGFDRDLGPVTLGRVDASVARGSYKFRCRLLHAVTGELLSDAAVSYDVK